jgi:thiamine transport system ATP-binding protein
MLDLVAEVADETNAGIMMVTHAPEDARRIADSVVFVADGVAHGPQATAGLFDNPPPALKAYLG